MWLSRELETAAFLEPVVALRDFNDRIKKEMFFHDEKIKIDFLVVHIMGYIRTYSYRNRFQTFLLK